MRAIGQLFIITLISIVVLEVICGAFYTMQNGEHRPAWFGGKPLETTKFKDDYDFDTVAIWTNRPTPRSEGLYAKEPISLPSKAADEYRVFIIGGSTTVNIRKPLGDRLSDHIERGLGSINGKRARVYNFGVPSYTTFTALSLLAGKLTGLQPDMIIAYDGVNDAHYGALARDDVWRDNWTDTAEGYRRRFSADINLQQTVRQRVVNLLQGVSYAMYFANEMTSGRVARAARSTDDYSPNEFAKWYASIREAGCDAPVESAKPYPGLSETAKARPEAAAAYARNVQTMQAATEAAGAKFVHVLQPTALNKRKLFPCENYSLRYNEAAYKNFKSEMSRQYDLLSASVGTVAAKQNSGIYLDLAKFTDEIDQYLYDDWHHEFTTGKLTEIVGAKIAAAILEKKKAQQP